MRRVVPLVVIAGLGVGATAFAAQAPTQDPYAMQEPDVTSGRVLRLPQSATGCDATRRATVRVLPPPGAILGIVRIVVDNRQAARLTGIPRAASATVRIPLSGARLTATAETLGGQRLHVTRVYSDCTRPPDTQPAPPPSGTGGGEG
jgi:hypothetical protein